MSGHQAEEQFLEQTPWANPQHPIHRLSRQNSNPSPVAEVFTPANQQRTTDGLQLAGSASTIVDPAAQVSSAFNTPHDEQQQGSTTKMEPQPQSNVHNYRLHSTSPLDTRRVASGAGAGVGGDFRIATDHSEAPREDTLRDLNSSPLTSRAQLAAGSPPRATSARPDKAASRFGSNESPFKHARDSGITAGSGFSGTGRFSIR